MDFGALMRFVDVAGTERPFDAAEVQTCIASSAGYSMGYSEGAAKDAPQRMLAFFGRHLRPR
jgi:dienelactone hydrolase